MQAAKDDIKYQHRYFCPMSFPWLGVNRGGRQMIAKHMTCYEVPVNLAACWMSHFPYLTILFQMLGKLKPRQKEQD